MAHAMSAVRGGENPCRNKVITAGLMREWAVAAVWLMHEPVVVAARPTREPVAAT
jgi:hypothetical protein